MHTGIPLWAALTIGIGTAGLSFAGSFVGQWWARKGAKELEMRSKREEALRVLRWAAELAVDEDERKVKLGVVELEALYESAILDDAELLFVDAALTVVYAAPAGEIDELERAGEDVDVELIPDYRALPAGDEEGEDWAYELNDDSTDDADGSRQPVLRRLPAGDEETGDSGDAPFGGLADDVNDEPSPITDGPDVTLGDTASPDGPDREVR